MPSCSLGVCHAILGTAVMEAMQEKRGCRWGQMLCQTGAGWAAERGLGHVAARCSGHAPGDRAAQHGIEELFCSSALWRVSQRQPEPPPASPSPWASSVQVGGCFGCCSPESYQKKTVQCLFFKTNPSSNRRLSTRLTYFSYFTPGSQGNILCRSPPSHVSRGLPPWPEDVA